MCIRDSVGTNRKPVCDFPLVINIDILASTISKLQQIIVQILDTAFLRGGATYTVHLGLTGKLVEDLLFVLIELISLGITAEALRANIDWKAAFLRKVGQFRPKFSRTIIGDVLREPFLHG